MPDYHNPYHPTNKNAMILSLAQQQDNAKFIYDYMHTNYNWTLNAVAAFVGNAAAESTMNPARPQDNAVKNHWYPSGPYWPPDGAPNPTDTWYGFGLFQITPFAAGPQSKRYNPYTYGNWAASHGYTMDYSTCGTCGKMEPQLIWFMSGAPEHSYINTADPKNDQKKWFQDSRSPCNAPTPAAFGQLTDTPENCSLTFYYNFIRSKADAPGDRPERARYWYDYLSNYAPTPPTPPEPPTPAGIFIPWYAPIFLVNGKKIK